WFASIVHVPVPPNETVVPEIAHTPALVASTVRLTGKPELALAETVYAGPLMLAPIGAAERKLIDWTLSDGAETVNDCCTCAAGWYVASPVWSASIVQVPAPRSDTEEPLIEQTPVLPAERLNVTPRPELEAAETG